MLSSMQKVLRSLLVGDDEVIPARGCSRADGVAEPTSPPAPLVCSPSQRSEFNDPGSASQRAGAAFAPSARRLDAAPAGPRARERSLAAAAAAAKLLASTWLGPAPAWPPPSAIIPFSTYRLTIRPPTRCSRVVVCGVERAPSPAATLPPSAASQAAPSLAGT
ncbi:hypothetical protein EMIHUDRAFT_203764 [Emiliania huxleyi CCMP1516]|uniref:Uncharacterized protein n=2 Tax=Emiliania huxleyi TaxID=2903 RepID=A0A0D3K0D0_EMIH1|nr:hypothetical protein EMIHUDRAFT_203764 [Emiliania huxleyi CCMP1516]EOD29215.1 hypothetical protein EMIHUDRAFT_203764 [Emiliania huxleyi CCMP1516]|eukprot:XP_005781644.1 hypothetical protein EMIHUDRAFT_203764 [Emiliania huxleyi CCMP1516]